MNIKVVLKIVLILLTYIMWFKISNCHKDAMIISGILGILLFLPTFSSNETTTTTGKKYKEKSINNQKKDERA
ncbi:MAG: hypothetical protein HXX81_01200 [Campylobacterales bacterium]|nr:hypothetical protein [Campylobacterales bacterium]